MVCCRGDFLSALIARIVVKVKYISLVNLIMDTEVVRRELLQYDLTEKSVLKELKAILRAVTKRKDIIKNIEVLKKKLGPAKDISQLRGRWLD